MLSVDFEKKNGKLNIYFDVGMPSVVENCDKVHFLIEKLKSIAGAQFYRSNGILRGFTVDLTRWFKFLEDIVTPENYLFQKEILDNLTRQDFHKQGEGLDVDFHQKIFDTPERYWRFILNQGNFIDYFFNRINWYLAPKNNIVTPFPVHVDLESASTCNMNCPMCYRNQLKETGQMDMELFKKAVNECMEHNVYSIRLSWRGETLTNPNIKEMIAYATKRIKNVSFLTNAFFLSEDILDHLIESKVSYVAVSFDGIKDVYEAIRYPAKFEENYNRLARLRDKKQAAESILPQVRLCTLWPAIREDSQAYYETMKEVSDYVVYNPYINFKGPMKIKPDFICQYPWERIVVAYNGKAQCCTGWNADDIVLGNVKGQSIYEMWHSDLMNEIRRLHSEGRRMELNSCANCRHGSQGDPDISIWEIVERRF